MKRMMEILLTLLCVWSIWRCQEAETPLAGGQNKGNVGELVKDGSIEETVLLDSDLLRITAEHMELAASSLEEMQLNDAENTENTEFKLRIETERKNKGYENKNNMQIKSIQKACTCIIGRPFCLCWGYGLSDICGSLSAYSRGGEKAAGGIGGRGAFAFLYFSWRGRDFRFAALFASSKLLSL